MNILFLGDVVGKRGMLAIELSLPSLIKRYKADFVIVNGENATHGKGLSASDYDFFVSLGVDAITLGNHWHSKPQIDDYIAKADHLIRPLNLFHYHQGSGSTAFMYNGLEIRVTNVLGQSFMREDVREPLLSIKSVINNNNNCIHIVDFHGESTSEKQIAAYTLDGRVAAVLGTHTHVQTNDARILPNGTAFICDVGMCGDPDGVIGFEKSSVINRIVLGQKGQFQIADSSRLMVNGVLIEVDEKTYKARTITVINEIVEE